MARGDEADREGGLAGERLRILAEHASELIVELGPGGRMLYVSPSVRDLLGYEPDEFLALGPLEIVHPEDRSATAEAYRDVLRQEGSTQTIHRARHRDGSWRWLHDVARSFRRNGALHVVVLGRDVCGQKRMEQELERQLAMESRVAQISRHFIALDSDRIDRGVREHLETAAEFAGADRCRLIVLEPGSRRPLGIYDWSAPGVALDMPEMDELGRGYLPWSGAALARGEVVQVASPQRLPPAADAERRDLLARGVGSLLGVPVRSSESVIGFQVFESLSGSRTWSERDLTPLRLLGEIFVSAVKRKFAEASLRESEERFRAIAEQAGGLVLEVDLAGRIRYVSPGAERLLGRAPEALVGRTAREITHPDDFEALQRVVVDTMRRQSEIRFVLRMRHRDGSWRWFESAGRAYLSATGDLRLLSTVQDITDRVAAERAVEQQLAVEKRVAELSRRFLALSPDEIDEEIRGAMVETAELAGADRSYLRSYGTHGTADFALYEWCAEGTPPGSAEPRSWSERELVAGRMLQFASLDALPQEAEAERRDLAGRGVRSLLAIPVRSGERTIGMIGFECRRAEREWAEHEVTLLRLMGEILVSALQRQRTELALRESESKLVHSQKLEAVGRLAGGIAHDFNNLLTVILGFSRPLLRDLPDDDPAHEDLVEIHGAAERAAAMTRQLLTLSRRQIVETEVVDLNAALSGLESLLGRLLGEDVELDLDLDPAIGGVEGDVQQLEQVVVNLAANARDAMPDGGTLRISTRHQTVDEDRARRLGLQAAGDYVRLRVVDSGHGMDEHTRAKIFDPFFTTKEPGRGTGLGLSIAYSVVEQARGAIHFEGSAGKGTSLEIWLPRAGTCGAQAAGASDGDPERGSGCILLVEDEPSVRKLTRRVLESHGYRVLEAEDGEAALRLWGASGDEIDALVTDVVMPRLGGFELARRVRGDRPEVGLLFISGYPEPEGRGAAGPPAGAPLLQKPFTSEALLGKLRDVLGARGCSGR